MMARDTGRLITLVTAVEGVRGNFAEDGIFCEFRLVEMSPGGILYITTQAGPPVARATYLDSHLDRYALLHQLVGNMPRTKTPSEDIERFVSRAAVARVSGVPYARVEELVASGLLRARLAPGARRTTYSLDDAREIARMSTTQRPA